MIWKVPFLTGLFCFTGFVLYRIISRITGTDRSTSRYEKHDVMLNCYSFFDGLFQICTFCHFVILRNGKMYKWQYSNIEILRYCNISILRQSTKKNRCFKAFEEAKARKNNKFKELPSSSSQRKGLHRRFPRHSPVPPISLQHWQVMDEMLTQ